MSGDAKRPGPGEVPAGSGEVRSTERGQIVDLEFVRGLIAAVDDSGVDSLEISRGGTRIRIAKTSAGPAAAVETRPVPEPRSVAEMGQPAAVPAERAEPATAPPAAPQAPPSNVVEITSPMVGTFYRGPAPEAPPYVEVGSTVVKGQTLCILEAMKLMNELESEVEGVVREICVENSEPVEYGQILFRIEPEA